MADPEHAKPGRAIRLTEEGDAEACDWTECDLTSLSEEEHPVRCGADDCRYLLTGLGETGRCPECGTPFDRRRRLWETYGPEAFALLPIRAEGGTSLGRALLTVVLMVITVSAPLGIVVVLEATRRWEFMAIYCAAVVASYALIQLWLVRGERARRDAGASTENTPDATAMDRLRRFHEL